MDQNEVYRRYQDATKRYCEELAAIQRDYIFSLYNFKKGDVVLFKNMYYKKPTLIVLDSIYFENNGNFTQESSYRNPRIKISGHMVDEDGYDMTYFPTSTQTIDVIAYAADVMEVTTIIPRGLRHI